MKRQRNRRNKCILRSESKKTQWTLELLLAAALPIQGLALHTESALAQSIPGGTVSVQYWDYRDWQSHAQRVQVHSPMVYFNLPAGDRNTIQGSYLLDTVSGASPYYLSTLSGASGMGIEEKRQAEDIKFTHSFDRFSIGAGANLSTENDYDSVGGLLESKIWSEDKNTTFALGISGNSDSISSSIDGNLHESKTTGNAIVGVTQVLNTDAILQSNLTFASGHGYFSDPYKPLDNRPNYRNQWAWLTRYNQYIPKFDAALHLDYRLYNDTYGVTSHMLEAAWYQPFLESWIIRPNLRYYTQSAATFFQDSFPPADQSQLFSADQRLSAFGGVSAGLKLIKDIGGGFSAQASVEYLLQRQDLRPGSSGSPDILPFNALFGSIGIVKKF